jgi:hypothetical protein
MGDGSLVIVGTVTGYNGSLPASSSQNALSLTGSAADLGVLTFDAALNPYSFYRIGSSEEAMVFSAVQTSQGLSLSGFSGNSPHINMVLV